MLKQVVKHSHRVLGPFPVYSGDYKLALEESSDFVEGCISSLSVRLNLYGKTDRDMYRCEDETEENRNIGQRKMSRSRFGY